MHKPILFLLLVHIILTLVPGATAKVSAIIVFGDSSVDSGNNNQLSTLLKSNFQPYGRDFYGGKPTGRFCNGRIPPDFISEAFGLKPAVPAYLDPMYNISDFVDGVNFASAGTGYDSATSDVLSVIPFMRELEYYKEYQSKLKAHVGDEKAKEITSEALYLLSLGTNDFLENYYTMPDRRSQFTVDKYQDYLSGIAGKFIKELYELGARKISLGGLPPMGCLPLERTADFFRGQGGECNENYNRVALNFNSKLSGLVKNLNQELSGIKVVLSNPYNILKQIVHKPSLYGFEVAGIACCSSGLFEMSYMCDRLNPFTCTDADKYVFWDSFHPSQKTNKIVSDYVIKNALHVFL
ncbi:GDSL esterase/lipase At2g04570 [Daucus carota subsp. sativus]|uniref:GDSL esterase/lipase At2g04570 n=1 Tax=Daucus carota subsp. sativus TaxID=79200 RepID=UPI0007EFE8B4|nr:PREDICTED: GDSL esterase/lipase At2g04570-like [Daucus carota subsp. sativus]